MFDYDPQDAAALEGATQFNDFVSLPFPTVLFRWVRGEAAASQTEGSGTKHFGGWAASDENMTQNVANEIPEYFQGEYFTSPTGDKAYMNYCARYLTISPFATRNRILVDNKDGKKRKHIQVACMAALVVDKVYNPWMPVILSVKGWGNCKWLEDEFKRWKDKTAVMRLKEAKNAPPNLFWMHFGTFGDKRMVETVGKGTTQGWITPPRAYIPADEKITVEWLQKIFIGRELIGKIAAMAEESKEWVDAWKNQEQPQAQQDPPGHAAGTYAPAADDEPPF